MRSPIYTGIITGAGGQLASCIDSIRADFPQCRLLLFDRFQAPIQDMERMEAVFDEHLPAFVINTAAYTAVDKAEADIEEAYLVNAHAVEGLAALCARRGVQFIHVSTDYVFNGQGTQPYKENDPTDPKNVYGASKLEGELLAMAANPHTVIVRTSWVYSPYGHNFVKTMLRLMGEREQISVVADQFGSPTYAPDLAEALLEIACQRVAGQGAAGIYHYSNAGVISWHQFATYIRNRIHSTCLVQPITTADYPTPARRPAYSVMDTQKINDIFGIQPKDWLPRLQDCLFKLRHGSNE